VPVSAFRAGSNSLEVYAVAGRGAQRRLTALATERPSAYRLREADAETTIEGDGRTYQVEKGRLQGYVDMPALDDQGFQLRGWAVDPDGPLPAERIVVFLDGRVVAQGRPTLGRPDIVENFGSDAVAKCGFELRGGAPGADLDDLRVFALGKDGASELPRYGG
jgi:hypothetical protein